jgi:dethiobiotin synthetase
VTTLLITGTDTDIGKTYFTAALLAKLSQTGRRCAGLKPVASGCENANGTLESSDARALMAASSVKLSYTQTNPYAFARPISPHLAAKAAGVAVELPRIIDSVRFAQARCDDVIIEGAGGWLSPIGNPLDHADIALALDIPVLLVVGIRLGCINHARLTAREIQRSGARLLGWIANVLPNTAQAAIDVQESIETLNTLMPAPMLARIDFEGMFDMGLMAAMAKP